MNPQAGRILAHYRLVEQIGEGGMGVVWKAVDTTLEREVAIKILPEAFAGNAERLARFEREAKLLASLNHTNIATVHGLHEADGVRFLAMELVAGEDLSKLLDRGPLPVQDALNVAGQVAEALEAAHEHGVIHRDLKPANIQITPGGLIKVLDFGLAKAFEPDAASGSATMSPTMTSAGTFAGMILGTAAYMSPEQAKGKPVDRRADIWAYGVVLLEMLSGKAVFRGESISETLACVMMSGPDFDTLPTATPASLRRLLHRCLEKEPLQRLRDIGEARVTIQAILGGHEEPEAAAVEALAAPARRGGLLPVAGLLVGALIAGAGAWTLKPDPALPLRKLDLGLKDTSVLFDFIRPIVIAPNGESVAYVTAEGLRVRELDRQEPREVARTRTQPPRMPIWSPDSEWVAYEADGRLWKVPATGGEAMVVTEVGGNFVGGGGGSWGEDGTIVFSRGNTGLFQVSQRGGDIRPYLELDPEIDDDLHEPSFLPGDRGVLFVRHGKDRGPDILELYADGQRKTLLDLEGQTLWNPVYDHSGHILYRRQPTNAGLWALPFSLDRLEVTGEPFLVAADADDVSVSRNGSMVYVRGAAVQSLELVWVDREGNPQGAIGQPQGGMMFPALSPDGARVAISAEENESRDIWIQDAVRGTKTRLSFGTSADIYSAWTPDGERVAYSNVFGSGLKILVKSSDGTGEEIEVGEGGLPQFSPDGRLCLVKVRASDNQDDIGFFTLGEGGKASMVIRTPADEEAGQISPDGRYLAYVSDESGRQEILLSRFPGGEGKWQVSAAGGTWPRWSGEGDELFYVESAKLMVVPVELGQSPVLGTPVELFDMTAKQLRVGGPRYYDVSADGERFVAIRSVGEVDDTGVTVIQNWISEFSDRP